MECDVSPLLKESGPFQFGYSFEVEETDEVAVKNEAVQIKEEMEDDFNDDFWMTDYVDTRIKNENQRVVSIKEEHPLCFEDAFDSDHLLDRPFLSEDIFEENKIPCKPEAALPDDLTQDHENVQLEEAHTQNEVVFYSQANHANKRNRFYECNTCQKVFLYLSHLKRHMVNHLPKTCSHICEECGKRFKSLASLRSHKRIHQVVESVIEAQVVENSAVLSNSEASTDDGEQGGWSFESSNQTCQSITSEQEDYYACKNCGNVFMSQSQLEVHVCRNKGDRFYECNICQKIFLYLYHLKRHMTKHCPRLSRQFLCQECGKSFASQSSFGVHTRMHEKERSLESRVPKAKMPAKKRKVPVYAKKGRGLDIETEISESERLSKEVSNCHECQNCGKVFLTHSQLNHHSCRRKDRAKSNGCEDGHQSEDVETLSTFMRKKPNKERVTASVVKEEGGPYSASGNVIWTEESAQHECSICGHIFLLQSQLDSHVCRNKGDQFFECNVCHKIFLYLYRLKRHMVKHYSSQRK